MPTGFREAICDDVLSALYDYWRSCISDEKLPGRADIDPIEMPRPALPHIVLAEVGDGGSTIRYRLVGTAIVNEWGSDFTGKYIEEIMDGSYLDFVRGLFIDVVTHRCAVLSESAFRWDVGRITGARRIYMPLASDGMNVDMVLIGQTFRRGDSRSGEPWKLIEATRGHTELERILDTR